MDKEHQEHIINLLCSSKQENIEVAELICQSQGVDIHAIVKDFGYNDIGINSLKDFMKVRIDAKNTLIQKSPKFPKSVEQFFVNNCVINTTLNLGTGIKGVSIEYSKIANINFQGDLESFFMSKVQGYNGELPKMCEDIIISGCDFIIKELPYNLRTLYIKGCPIKELPKLPDSLEILTIYQTLLKGLPNIPKNLEAIWVDSIDLNKYELPKNCKIEDPY